MKINILCLGESIANYKPDGNITIGVNDIFKLHPVDYLVVIDPPTRFNKDRLLTILNSNPRKFYSHYYNEWRPLVQNLQQLNLSAGYNFFKLDEQDTCLHSNNSAFVACVLAYKMGATEIVLHGADFNTHPSFHEQSIKTAIQHFKELYYQLKKRNVKLSVGSTRSRLFDVLPVSI